MFTLRKTPRQRLGAHGERLAARYLAGLGYRIAARNVTVLLDARPGASAALGELDIVAYDRTTLVFVEVKTRRRAGLLPAERAVDTRKRALLVRSAARYRSALGLRGEPYRFDVVTVLLPKRGAPMVRHLRNYFLAPGIRRLPHFDT